MTQQDEPNEFEKTRRHKIMASKIANKLYDLCEDRIDTLEFVRAGTTAICNKCGLENIKHPYISKIGLYINCNGELLKL